MVDEWSSERACSARLELCFERSSEHSWERTSTGFMVVVVVVVLWEVLKGSSSASEAGEGGAKTVIGMVFSEGAPVSDAMVAGFDFSLRDAGVFVGLVVCELA